MVVNLGGLKMIGQSDESRIACAVTSVKEVSRVEPVPTSTRGVLRFPRDRIRALRTYDIVQSRGRLNQHLARLWGSL